jgi:hypothetical protein
MTKRIDIDRAMIEAQSIIARGGDDPYTAEFDALVELVEASGKFWTRKQLKGKFIYAKSWKKSNPIFARRCCVGWIARGRYGFHIPAGGYNMRPSITMVRCKM